MVQSQKQSSEVFCKKSVLKNFTKFLGKNLCWSLFSNKVAGLRPTALLKKTPTQVFSFEFCKTFKNTFFTEPHPRLLLQNIESFIQVHTDSYSPISFPLFTLLFQFSIALATHGVYYGSCYLWRHFLIHWRVNKFLILLINWIMLSLDDSFVSHWCRQLGIFQNLRKYTHLYGFIKNIRQFFGVDVTMLL